uniref:Transcription factor n=1 Tax=Solanum tuberosum TaxID=4113 RepID=M0ZG00_SOLTU
MFKIGSVPEVIERYKRHTKDKVQPDVNQSVDIQNNKQETASLMKKIELLESSKRKLLGEGLGSCSLEEVQQIEKQLEQSVTTIRARKMQVFREQMERLKERERALTAENMMLRELKFGGDEERGKSSGEKEREVVICIEGGSDKSDVETELFIGQPHHHDSRIRRPEWS